MLTKSKKILLRIFISILRVYAKFDNFIFSQEFINSIIFVILLIFAGLIRYFALDYSGSDYELFLSPWYDYIIEHGGWKALSYNFANYTPPYLYFLVILTYLPIPKLIGIKLVSIFFDFILAYFVFFIVSFWTEIKRKQQNYNQIVQKNIPNNTNLLQIQPKIQNETKNLQTRQELTKLSNSDFSPNLQQILAKHSPIIAFFAVLFSPTVIFNGAFWAQCDVIYTTFLVVSFLAILKKKYFLAVFWFAISLSFKLQAMFFLPVFIVLLMLRKINFLHFLILPIVYILAILPSFLIGRNFVELLRIYIDQGISYNNLTMNSPNFYHWFGEGNYEILAKMGLSIAGITFVGVCYLFYHLGRQIYPSNLPNFQFQKLSQKTHLFNFESEFETPKQFIKTNKLQQISESSLDLQTNQNLPNHSPDKTQKNEQKPNHLDLISKQISQNNSLDSKLPKQNKFTIQFTKIFTLLNLNKKYQQEKQLENPYIETKMEKLESKIDWNLEVKKIDFWMNLSLISVLILPYFLPKMHERYFFVADIFAILYVFWRPRRFWIAILINLCSFFAYGPFLLGTKPFDFSYLSMALLVTIIYLLVTNIKENLNEI